MIDIRLGDNIQVMQELISQGVKVQAIYADCIYQNDSIVWSDFCFDLLGENGVFYVQTDYHTSHIYRYHLDRLFGQENFLAELIYFQEWGGVPKKGFPIKHDNILMYAKGKDWKWYGDRIQIRKATAGTKLDKKGTGLKTPCSVFYDLGNFSTISKERVKFNGHNIQWQKSLALMNRLLLPVTDEGDIVLDCFSGSGTTGVWCKNNNRNYIGIENSEEIYKLSLERLEKFN